VIGRQWRQRRFPVIVAVMITAALWLFGFVPLQERATADRKRAQAAEAALEAKIELLEQVPQKKHALDSLVDYLRQFRADLFRTDQVGAAMRAFESRAAAAGVSLWTLDPSVPTLVKLDAAPDSVVALQLAVLPVKFECRGEFVSVGRFLEQEEHRAGFNAWRQLDIAPGIRPGEIRASGEASIFLLPAENTEANPS